MILLIIEIISCGYLGYKRFAWWLPAVVGVCGFLVFFIFLLHGRFVLTNLLANIIASYIGFGTGLGIRKVIEARKSRLGAQVGRIVDE
jgi:hypothetical protein